MGGGRAQASANAAHYAAIPSTGASGGRPRIMSAAFSAIIIVVAYVLADGMFGMIEASTTRSPCIPCTRNWSSTTDDGIGRRPHPRRADQMIRGGAILPRKSSNSSSLCTSGPGSVSPSK